MQEKIKKIIIEILEDINEDLENENLNHITDSTKLYGANGALDSLALVSFITDLEERISEDFDQDIILADEKAMSQKTSPFRNVESLTNYIANLIEV